MNALSLPATSSGPSEKFLDRLSVLLKDRPCISLLGKLEFDPVDRTRTTGLVQLDQSERPYPANAYAPEPIMVPRAAEMTVYLFVPTDINESVPNNLEEIYHTTIVPRFGLRYATVWYWWQIACQIMSSTEPRLRKLLLWIGGLVGLKKLFDLIGLGGP